MTDTDRKEQLDGIFKWLADNAPYVTFIPGRRDELSEARAASSPPSGDGEWQMAIEAAATVALEQRCERGTPWDRACVTIAEAIRSLPPPPPSRGEAAVAESVYLSAVKGRQNFRAAFRQSREHVEKLHRLLHDVDEAINPPDRSGISLAKWNERLKAITARIRDALRGEEASTGPDADMRAFSASEAACYKWPDDTPAHVMARAAYCEGAADYGAPAPAAVAKATNTEK